MSDITETLAPKSDQLDAVDLLGGPRVFTVDRVVVRKAGDQPVDVHLRDFPRVWRPGKSMRRVLGACWSNDSATWPGRRVELFCDTEVMFGGKFVGGTRISRLSHIDGRKKVPLIISKGKSEVYTVEALPDQTVDDQVAALRAEWHTANEERRAAITAEVQRLQGGAS